MRLRVAQTVEITAPSSNYEYHEREMMESATPYARHPAPRKRRRPALACEQCRRRKIKCDQNLPCNQCQRSKSIPIHACTYVPATTPSYLASTSRLYASLPSQKQLHPPLPLPLPPQRQRQLPQPRPQLTPKLTASISRGNRYGNTHAYPSPGTANLSDQSSYADDQRSDITRSAPNAGRNFESAVTIQALLDRVQLLEKKLAENAGTSTIDISSSPASRLLASLEVPAESEPAVRGVFSKTRFFGSSHWMNCAREFHTVYGLRARLEVEDDTGIAKILDRCKVLARAAKIRRPIRQPDPADFKDLVPTRETADLLVQGYLRTFETVYRILHVPTFQQEYLQFWSNPQSASPAFVVRLLLVMALGTCFYKGQDISITPRTTAAPWIYAAQAWLGGPSEKTRVNISCVQIQCLLLLARQTCAIDGDLVWILSGSLLRAAMYVGLHRDPQHLPKMPSFQAELRRRLWASVLEIVLQSSMDAGGAPLICRDDYDCEPPSSIDDLDMNADDPAAVPFITDKFTQTTVQIALMKSVPVRLEMAKAMNGIRHELSYDEVLKLSSELITIYRENSLYLLNPGYSSQEGTTRPTPFQMNCISVLTNRFILALHHPFAVKSKTNPRFYFSRKICLDAALHILSPSGGMNTTNNNGCNPCINGNPNANSRNSNDHDDFYRLTLHSGAFVRSTLIYAKFTICLELLYQLQEDASSIFPSSVPPFLSCSSSAASRSWRSELHAATENYMQLAKGRILAGETNIKGYLFGRCVMAQIKAMEDGVADIEQAIIEAGKVAVAECYTWLKERAQQFGCGEVDEQEEGGGAGANDCSNDYDGGYEKYQGIEWEGLDSQFLFDIPDSWLFSSLPAGGMFNN
ncbi:hypothetical protein PABG_05098 [Paracoccidioides brasiliensis Pb03]|nr:hypothetical protein PABG_05098 [Paracoccidioides brasiliensis Pb03]